MKYPVGWDAIARFHPTYRCAICRSLLVMGEGHSHRTSNRIVRHYLGLTGTRPTRYASGTGDMR